MNANSLVMYGFSLGAITAVLFVGGSAALGAIVWMAIEKICDFIESHQI